MTVVDRFSRWFTATPKKEITAEATIEAFVSGWIQYFGCPLSVVTDQGGQFTGYLWKNLMSVLGIRHATTTSYHPQANGLVENLHRRLKDALRMQKFPDMWYFNLPIVLLVLRTTLKEDFPLSPAELVYGQDLRLPGEFKTQNMPSVLQRQNLVQHLKDFIQKSQYLSIDLKSSIQPLNHHSMKQTPSNLPLKKRLLQPMMMIQHLNKLQNLPIKFEPGMAG